MSGGLVLSDNHHKQLLSAVITPLLLPRPKVPCGETLPSSLLIKTKLGCSYWDDWEAASSHPSYWRWMSGKLPLILTSDPGQKKVPDLRPWYRAVCQICQDTSASLASTSCQHFLSGAARAALTGWPRYQAGLLFSSLDRLKVASSSGSYITLSIRPLDSG